MIPSIERLDLSGPLRRQSGSATVEPLKWRVEQLGGGFGNPVSLGLYRVSGEARDGEHIFSWSLVLKAAQSPANVGMADLGGGDDPSHWNYWRREYDLYSSGLLDHLPPGSAAPRFYGAAERPGDVYWLWLEVINDGYHGHWPATRYQLAARHLGRLGAAFLPDWHPAAYPWLARATLRQWLVGPMSIAPQMADTEWRSEFLNRPVMGRLFSKDSVEVFNRCVSDYGQLLDALDRLPQTLGHQDTYPTNLMSRTGSDGQEETVALDWGLAGTAPIGSDLAQLFIGLAQNFNDLPAGEAGALLLEGYLAGLRDLGWAGDEQQVALGFKATTVLRLVFLMIFYLQGASSPDAGSEALTELGANLDKLARLFEHLAPQVFQLIDPV